MGRSILKAIVFGVVFFGSLAVQADTLTTPNSTLPGVAYCGGFGCGQYFTQYQQVFSGAVFGGSVTLNSLTMYNVPGSSGVVPGHYTVDLSTTTAQSAYDLTSASGLQRWNMDMDGLNHPLGGFSNFDLNKVGATQIFDGDLSTTNGTLTFTIPGGYAFDGTQNLLLSVTFQPTSNTPSNPMNGFFTDSLDPNASSSILFGALFDDNGNPVLDADGNQVMAAYVQDDSTPTTFDYTPAPVPEPSSIALLITGLAGLSGMARRRFHT